MTRRLAIKGEKPESQSKKVLRVTCFVCVRVVGMVVGLDLIREILENVYVLRGRS